MNIYIGENIKRLRTAKNITQEKLAEYLSISTQAVSKWERGETFPDITMILPLASYFNVSTDELFGFDAAKNEQKVKDFVTDYKRILFQGKTEEAERLLIDAYKEFPNDFRIIDLYMWKLIGGLADNDEKNILAHRDELVSLCQRILDECTIDSIRNNAINMLAKVYKAEGNIEKALETLDRFPGWFGTIKGQKCEQLYEKRSNEWWHWLNRNVFDLSDFLNDKIFKMIWFSEKAYDEKIRLSERIIEYLQTIQKETSYEPLYYHIMMSYAIIAGKCRLDKDLGRAVHYYELCMSYAKKFDDFIASDRQIYNAPNNTKKDIASEYGPNNSNQVKRLINIYENQQLYEELRNTNEFKLVLEKYRPYAKDIK